MTTQTEAMKLALEALEKCEVAWPGTRFKSKYFDEEKTEQAITALREARAAQPAREWVGLTLEEIDTEWGLFMSGQGSGYIPDFVHAIEAKLKEKNT